MRSLAPRLLPGSPSLMPKISTSGFAALNVLPAHLRLLDALNFVTPTPIQALSIPIAMRGQDLIGVAQTGTGKTLAFSLPMLANLKPGEVGLVLAPTRELAHQIAETLQKLNARAVLVIGGAAMSRQIKELRNRHDVIVATPGRLIDHLQQGSVRLNRVACVVLDEGDRMLDMGFEPAIRQIFNHVPKKRQTMLFSATMADEVVELSRRYLNNPERVDACAEGTAAELVEQKLVFVTKEEKVGLLADLLYQNNGSVLVFTRTRHGARQLTRKVIADGHSAAEIHSDRTLNQRRDALQGFKEGIFRVLIATDIAARGIDVKGISLVINYDVPEKPDDYVHRIGRTGRAGLSGRAITIAIPEQTRDIRDIEKLLGQSIAVCPDMSTAEPRPNATARNRPKQESQPNPRRKPEPTFAKPKVEEPAKQPAPAREAIRPERLKTQKGQRPRFEEAKHKDAKPKQLKRNESQSTKAKPNAPSTKPWWQGTDKRKGRKNGPAGAPALAKTRHNGPKKRTDQPKADWLDRFVAREGSVGMLPPKSKDKRPAAKPKARPSYGKPRTTGKPRRSR